MKVIAHRGYSKKFPENTLLAFEEALKIGADAIELDVHFSRDHQLIVHHDYDLAHPSGGKGLLPQTDAVYIKALDAGSWFNSAFSEERIPFLGEVFEKLGKRTEYELELKGFTEEFVQAVLQLAQHYDVLRHIEFTSPHAYLLTTLKRLCPQAKVGMFVAPPPEWMDQNLWQEITTRHALLGGVDLVHIPIELLNEAFVEKLHEHGLGVHAADCDTAKEIAVAYACGADQFSTIALDIVK
jgi:glycerophosphoryl diester phosphodiesterase